MDRKELQQIGASSQHVRFGLHVDLGSITARQSRQTRSLGTDPGSRQAVG